MTTLSASARDSTKALVRQTAALKTALKALVKSLPPNPDVRRVSRNCCVVSSKTLMAHKIFGRYSSWSPSYWINAEMERALCDIVDKSRPENLRKTIVQILRRGVYEIKYGQTMHIHPFVLKTMRRAWLRGN
jgi:hypothetical protein